MYPLNINWICGLRARFLKTTIILSTMIIFNCRVITIAANSQEEKDKWLEDIAESVQAFKGEQTTIIEPPNVYLSLKSCSKTILLIIRY